MCIRCERYFLCGNKYNPRVYLKANPEPNPPGDLWREGRGSFHSCSNLLTAGPYQTPNQTSLDWNMETWESSKTSNYIFIFLFSSGKTKQWTIKGGCRGGGGGAGRRRASKDRSLGPRSEEVNLWWVGLFFCWERGLSLKYSGWWRMGDWPLPWSQSHTGALGLMVDKD